jgi:hypothetical protein
MEKRLRPIGHNPYPIVVDCPVADDQFEATGSLGTMRLTAGYVLVAELGQFGLAIKLQFAEDEHWYWENEAYGA